MAKLGSTQTAFTSSAYLSRVSAWVSRSPPSDFFSGEALAMVPVPEAIKV